MTTPGVPLPLSPLSPLGPSWEPHALHGRDRVYAATACYIDLVIEFLAWRGLEPRAMLGSLVRLEWGVDQFTTLKPRQEDLDLLFGLEIHEFLPYKPLLEHIVDRLRAGAWVIFEADTFYLPDMEGVAYRIEHERAAILPTSLDPDAERMTYLHGTGHHVLAGEDFRGVLGIDDPNSARLSPFSEHVAFRSGTPPDHPERLRALAGRLLVRHAARRAPGNPFLRWGESLAGDLERLSALEHEPTQGYAFVSARMAGGTCELLADHLEWLLGPAGAASAAPLRQIANACRTMTFRLARRRRFDFAPLIAELAASWAESMEALAPALAGYAASEGA